MKPLKAFLLPITLCLSLHANAASDDSQPVLADDEITTMLAEANERASKWETAFRTMTAIYVTA